MIKGKTKKRDPYLHVFKAILLTYATQDVFLATLLHLSSKEQLIENEICLLEIEYDVQLADIAIILVHLLHKAVNNLECNQLIV
jgi:hypothetical protein